MNRRLKVLVSCAVLAGAFEVVQILLIEEPVAAAVMAGLFLLMGWLVREPGARRSVSAAVLGVLFLVDGGGVLVYERANTLDYLVQFGFAALCACGLAAAIGVLLPRREAVA